MDSTYAPQSPDLSSFLSSPPKTQQPYNPQQNSQTTSTSYAPRSPVLPSFNTSSAPQPHNHNLHSSYQNPVHPFGAQVAPGGNEFGEYGSNQYMPPIPPLPQSHSFRSPQQHPASPYFQNQYRNPHIKPEDSYTSADADSDYIPSPTMASRQPRGKASSSQIPASNPQYKDPNPNNIEIKTKFPVARIKRIMQADEEVGKVAQVTPVAVSKALELFMIALVSGSAEKAKEKGGKRVTAQHLKQVVLDSPDQFDFLAEIVGRVSDAQEGAGGEGKRKKEKVENGSESSEEEKKPKKGKGRRKKSDD